MGIFDKVASSLESKATNIADYTWAELFPQTNAKSGVSVNIDSALRVSTVFACTRVLAEGIAQLPISVWDEDSAGNKTQVKDDLHNVLAKHPNDWMTSFELREQMTMHAVLTGNAYAYLGRGGNKLVEIIPLVPGSVQVVRKVDWTLEYHVSDLAGNSTIVPPEDILHLRGPSWNGYLGMEAVQLAREAIGLAISTEETHASLHANGAQPGGVLSVKGKLDGPARERLKAAWQAFQGGVANRFKTAVLDTEATWTPMSMTGVDSQHLETRRFQIEEICREFRVFPQMVMHSDKTSTFASAEAFFLSHVTHSLMPWVKRWQEALDRALFKETPNLSVKLSVKEILKGSMADQAAFYMAALGGARGETAYMTRNEVRHDFGLNPIAGGDKLLIPPDPAPPVAGDGGGKPGFKYSPDQPRDDHGRFGSGATARGEHHLARVGATVAVQAIAGALKGGEGGLYGAVAGAAIGAAIAAFVEFGGANFVGEHIIALVGPHVLPDWAHEMLVDHHENHGKSFHAVLFSALSDEDKKRFCLDTLNKMSPEMLAQLGEKIVAGSKSYSFKYNPDQPSDSHGRFGSGASQLYKAPTKTADQLIEQYGARQLVNDVEARLAHETPTNVLHTMPNGEYTAERQRVHEAILRSVFNEKAVLDATPTDGKPVLSVIGGRGGSGKSFITGKGGPVDSAKSILLDSDKFKAALPEYKGWNAAMLHEEADTLLKQADQIAASLGVNVTHDATLKSEANSAARVAAYTSKGYDANGYFVHATAEVAVGRALGRFVRGGGTGRYVPPDVILGNTKNESNFDNMAKGFKHWRVYDNNGDAPRLVAQGNN